MTSMKVRLSMRYRIAEWERAAIATADRYRARPAPGTTPTFMRETRREASGNLEKFAPCGLRALIANAMQGARRRFTYGSARSRVKLDSIGRIGRVAVGTLMPVAATAPVS